ncbi:amontillado-like protein [Euroglyphus maynei]|uniref:Amontillado-like protein n=1 Tax=Euroglyphus maynei TaxID=6958 RepID=A0A1Y3AME1_EURMA|nr:amontillado-like protein [Euroglyphus maynei]
MFMMAILLILIITVEQSIQNPQEVFTNSFHIRFRRDVDHQNAHQIAKRHGFINLGPTERSIHS